jgi:hypothetical protein
MHVLSETWVMSRSIQAGKSGLEPKPTSLLQPVTWVTGKEIGLNRTAPKADNQPGYGVAPALHLASFTGIDGGARIRPEPEGTLACAHSFRGTAWPRPCFCSHAEPLS